MNNLSCVAVRGRLTVLFLVAVSGLLSGVLNAKPAGQLATEVEKSITIGMEEAHRRIKTASEISALSDDLFGDRISLSNGSGGFFQSDLDVPGNGTLPVRIGRSFNVGLSRPGKEKVLPFGDWDLDLPSLSGVFHIYGSDAGWTSSMPGQPNRRCSVSSVDTARPRHVTREQNGAVAIFQPSEFWHGIRLTMPGGAQAPLMVIAPENVDRPNSTVPYYWTTSGNWLFSCSPSTANGYPGESFVGISPAGEKYWFNWAVQYHDFGLSKKIPRSNTVEQIPLERREVRLMPTRVEDRFGNWVIYEYDPIRTNRLLRISSNDGRSIDVTYNAEGRISQISSESQVWRYEYNATGALATVRRPDGSTWGFTLGHLRDLDLFANHQICYDPGAFPLDARAKGVIRHPSGAVGEFTFQRLRRPRSYVPRVCYGEPGAHPWYDIWGIVEKKLSGPNTPTMAWTYSYKGSGSYADQCLNNTCADTSETLVTGPAGVWQRHVFSTRYGPTEGLPRRQEIGDASGAHRVIEHAYQESPNGQPYPARLGFKPEFGADSTGETIVPARSRVITQSGVTYSWQALAFNRWGLPLEVRRSSSLGYEKGEFYSYRDFYDKWVLNQLVNRRDRATNTAEEVRFYRPEIASLLHINTFGIRDYSRDYDAQGNLASALLYHQTFIRMQDYYRGVPRRIVYDADNSQSALTVDALGRIRSMTDALSNTTNYEYDTLGRLTQTRYPAADSTSWSNQDTSYQMRTAAEYGIDAGLWRRTQTRGRYEHVTWFDALWRPILTRERDTTLAGSERFVRKAYDSRGNLSFESYPGVLASTNTSYTTLSSGISRQFDALNRPTVETRSSELGNLVSRREYLSPGLAVRDINARGAETITEFMAYDEPNYHLPMVVRAPDHRIRFTRDRWGKPTDIARFGSYQRPDGLWESNVSRRYFVYDVNQRLCKRIDPEHGATVTEYDASSRIIWTAEGLDLPSTSECNRESVAANQRVARSYNVKGDLVAVDYPDSTDDLSFTYYANGKQQTASVGPIGNRVTRTYSYNKRGLPTQELTQIDGLSFPIGYRYSSEGAVSQIGYPDNAWENLNPDGMGRPRQLGQFASNITWHRFGPLASFTYGNGLSFSQSLNARGLPSARTDSWYGSARLSDTYSWDANGNLTAINDLVGDPSSYRNASRWLTYDEADRLIIANSSPQPELRVSSPWGYSWGEARFSYDGLDNLRTFKMGAADFTYAYESFGQGRLLGISQAGVPNPILTYKHNARGQMTERQFGGQTFALNWDSAHRLTQTRTANASVVETYRYDAHGHRVRTVRGGETLYQVYTRGGDLVWERSTNGTTRKYARVAGRLIGESVNGVRRAVQTDVIGSVRQKTDNIGTIVHEDVRAPYGSTLSGRQYQNGPAFTGHMEDGATGLTYMKARYYDPVAMRFISPDPVYVDLSTGSNFNRYWYANNNPYSYTDPDGRLGRLIGLRATHDPEEATRIHVAVAERQLDAAVNVVEISPVGTAVDVVEISAELAMGKEPVDKATGALAGDVVSEVAEKALEKRVGAEAARLIGGVLGKVVGDMVEGGIRGELSPASVSEASLPAPSQDVTPTLNQFPPIVRNEMIQDKP